LSATFIRQALLVAPHCAYSRSYRLKQLSSTIASRGFAGGSDAWIGRASAADAGGDDMLATAVASAAWTDLDF